MDSAAYLEIYKLFRHDLNESYKLHRLALRQYLTLSIAILGASFASMTQIDKISISKGVFLIGPIFNIIICLIAIRICNLAYRGVLERTTIILKLEELLVLNELSNIPVTTSSKRKAFQEDIFLFPQRWIMSARSCSDSNEFIKKYMNLGVNLVARFTFGLIIIVNIALIFVIASFMH